MSQLKPLQFGERVRMKRDYNYASILPTDTLIVIRAEHKGNVTVAAHHGTYPDLPANMFRRMPK